MVTENQIDDAETLLGRAQEFGVDAATLEGLSLKIKMQMLMGAKK